MVLNCTGLALLHLNAYIRNALSGQEVGKPTRRW